MKKRFARLAALFSLATIMAIPQLGNTQSSIVYGSSRNPLMNSENPAFFPSRSKVYLMLPGINLGLQSPVAFNDVFQLDSTGTKSYINANNLLDDLTDNGRIRVNTTIQAVGLGLNFDKFFITLSSQFKVDAAVQMPRGLYTFLTEGNANYTGDRYLELIDGSFAVARAYAEGAVGFGYRINDNITVGGRAKLLTGYLDLSDAGNTTARLYTDPNYTSITGVANLDMNFTSILEEETDPLDPTKKKWKMGKNFFPTKNSGFTIDLGGRYATDRFEVSMSINDLGPGIHWTDNVKRIVSKEGESSFTFTGVDVSQWMQGGEMDSTVISQLLDSLKRFTKYDTRDGEAYWTRIPVKLNLGGMYNFNSFLSAGAHFHGEFGCFGNYTSTSFIARFNLKDQIEIVALASAISNNGEMDWFNPGVGITVTPGRVFQIYTMLDYISNFYLVKAKSVNISFGINLFFGSSDNR